jgi:hypothetical protein
VPKAVLLTVAIIFVAAGTAAGGYFFGRDSAPDADAAREEGADLGRREGVRMGEERGYQRGYEEGRKRGRRQGAREAREEQESASVPAAPTEPVEKACGDLATSGAGTYNVRAQGLECTLAITVARQWESECASEPDGSCVTPAGFDCRYEQAGIELGYITCTSGDRRVQFETGA